MDIASIDLRARELRPRAAAVLASVVGGDANCVAARVGSARALAAHTPEELVIATESGTEVRRLLPKDVELISPRRSPFSGRRGVAVSLAGGDKLFVQAGAWAGALQRWWLGKSNGAPTVAPPKGTASNDARFVPPPRTAEPLRVPAAESPPEPALIGVVVARLDPVGYVRGPEAVLHPARWIGTGPAPRPGDPVCVRGDGGRTVRGADGLLAVVSRFVTSPSEPAS